MAQASPSDTRANVLRGTIVALVRRDTPDLSARQLAIFLICGLEDREHTVRGLAAVLDISKPAVTRSIDRAEELGPLVRKPDPGDGRSLLVGLTPGGRAFLREVRKMLSSAELALINAQP